MCIHSFIHTTTQTLVDSALASVVEAASMPAGSSPAERTAGPVDAGCYEV